jgi:hypothetical protein
MLLLPMLCTLSTRVSSMHASPLSLLLVCHLPISPGRGAKLGSHGVKIDGVALLITVFDMTELTESSPPDAAEGSVGAVKTDTDARSLAARTKLRLLCYDPVHNSSGSLVCASCIFNPRITHLCRSTCQPRRAEGCEEGGAPGPSSHPLPVVCVLNSALVVCACGVSPQILTAKVLLQGLRQLAGLEHKAEGLVAMLGTPVGRYRAALSLAPLLCLYWPKVALDTSATKVG